MQYRPLWLAIAAVGLPMALQAQAKRPLDHDVYDGWRTIEDERISDDGRWVVYSLVPQLGDAELEVRSVSADARYSVARGRGARFSGDGAFVVFRIEPELSAVEAAKRQRKKEDEIPKDSLGILDLRTGTVTRVESVKSFKVPEDAGAWVAYLLHEPVAERDSAGGGRQPDAGSENEDEQTGSTLVLRDLSRGTTTVHQHVADYAFAANGTRLGYLVAGPHGNTDGAYAVNLADGAVQALITGPGKYKLIVLDEGGTQAAFLTTRDDHESDPPAFALYHWRHGSGDARLVATEGTPGVPPAWWVSEHRSPSFSKHAERLLFGTAPRPDPVVVDSTPEADRVKVDIWHWQDPLLQPMQLLQAKEERERSYLAVLHLRDGRVVQLGSESVPDVGIGEGGDAAVALGRSDLPYRRQISWDFPWAYDYYAVDVRAGQRRLIAEAIQDSVELSPNGEYAVWWDNVELGWYGKRLRDDRVFALTEEIPFPLYNEEHDWPHRPESYQNAGWTADDAEFLVYDRYDVWAVDPEGRRAPRNVTDGVGRRDSVRFRYVPLDPEATVIPRDAPMLLAAFNYRTKASGFYRDVVSADDRRPVQLVMMGRRFGDPTKAKDADVMLLTRESVVEFPNLWTSDLGFEAVQQVSDANPQQADYRWASAELVDWRSTEGQPLQGLLYKPDDFDPSAKYPMMVYFYERNSNNLHAHHPPIPHRSIIRPTFYASRGYVVFIPDITYQVGYPGESAMDAVIPGVLELVDQGFIDETRIGVQGHSWGGYQIAYMVTKTNIFEAAAGGAPVSNMTSAYGGIRWASGMSRMFQYEKTQSRIGATLWEAPMRYIENSPLFWVDKVETPLLMMHNDHDGAVPWYQGIEMFVALRRFGKPAWLVNYNDEPHWPTTYPNKKDWNIRITFIIATRAMAGSINGNTTRNMVRSFPAPDTAAASSNAASMFLKAGVNSMTF